MTDMEPCPFCGGKYVQVRYIGGEWQEPSAFVSGYRGECCSCHAITAAYDTEAQAAAAWNTRHVETCELTLDGTDGCFGCSECLENIPPLANYCPNCGRKVEG